MKNKTLRPPRRRGEITSLDRAAKKNFYKVGKLSGQSLIDVVFAIGILVLVLTGVVTLVVSTSKLKTISLERSKAVEISQGLIEAEVKEVKQNPLDFWTSSKEPVDGSIDGYTYNISYECTIDGTYNDNCKVIFTVNWGDGKELSVERLFLKNGI